LVAAATAKSITTPIEVAIKNTYNAVEPWVAYGVQWVEYVAGLIPIVNWFTPAIGLAYNTIEPLVRAGTYATADLIGLNFAAIWPDIWTGITTSSTNFITGVLNWANIPLPPPLPGAAVAPAASLRAAAAVAAPAEVAEVAAPEAPAVTGPATGTAPKADNVSATGNDAPAPAVTAAAERSVPEPAAPAVESAPAAGSATTAAIEVAPPAVAELPAADSGAADTPAPARTAHRGPSASGATGDSANAGAPAKAGRQARGSD
jgi:hypothetical protein